MPIFNNADSVQLGSSQIDQVFLGSNQVWQRSIPITVTGGTLFSDDTYYYRVFTSNDNLTISGGPLDIEVLVVGGGGGGGA